MSMEWLNKALWSAHVSWLTPPWVGKTEEKRADFDAKRWLDQIQSAHYRTLIFYTKHHDGYRHAAAETPRLTRLSHPGTA